MRHIPWLGFWLIAALGAAATTHALTGAIWVGRPDRHLVSAQEVAALADDLAALPFGDVFVKVRQDGTVYYTSAIEPRAHGIEDGFDPLAALIERLRHGTPKRRVFAWIDPMRVGDLGAATPVAPSHVRLTHPGWLSRRDGGAATDAEGGQFLELGLPEVREHLKSLVRELTTQYELDGLYLDPVAEAGADWGFHEEVVRRWMRRNERATPPRPDDASWRAFRTDLITQLLEELAAEARRARPGIEVAVGVVTTGAAPPTIEGFASSTAATTFHQNWPAWVADATVDRIVLRTFFVEGAYEDAYRNWVGLARQAVGEGGEVRVVAGVAGFLNESVDVLAQMRRAAEAGADGIALADYAHPMRDLEARDLLMDAAAQTLLADSTPPRPTRTHIDQAPLRSMDDAQIETVFELPPPPTVAPVESVEFVEMEIDATPSESTTPPTAASHISGADRETVQAMRALAGLPPEPTPEPADFAEEDLAVERRPDRRIPVSRRDALAELIGDPAFRRSRRYDPLRPDDRAVHYLRSNFSNIFGAP